MTTTEVAQPKKVMLPSAVSAAGGPCHQLQEIVLDCAENEKLTLIAKFGKHFATRNFSFFLSLSCLSRTPTSLTAPSTFPFAS